jgi:hypothetical protein
LKLLRGGTRIALVVAVAKLVIYQSISMLGFSFHFEIQPPSIHGLLFGMNAVFLFVPLAIIDNEMYKSDLVGSDERAAYVMWMKHGRLVW